MRRIYFRTSDAPKKPGHVAWATREICLRNLVELFQGRSWRIQVLADNCSNNSIETLKKFELPVIETHLGNSGSFRHALDLFLQESGDSADAFAYFVEDDYLHRRGADQIVLEGLSIADYVTLYDHADKYSELYGYGEMCKVVLTESCHWKTTCSTCMTFASTAQVLRQDREVWYEHLSGPVPLDHQAFIRLGHRQRDLVSPIPGYATHLYERWLSPMVDWRAVASKYAPLRRSG